MKPLITTETIKALNPCIERLDSFLKHYPSFSGTLEEFVCLTEITYSDKVWVGLRLLSRVNVEVFAIDCAVSADADNDDAADAERKRQIEAILYLYNLEGLNK